MSENTNHESTNKMLSFVKSFYEKGSRTSKNYDIQKSFKELDRLYDLYHNAPSKQKFRGTESNLNSKRDELTNQFVRMKSELDQLREEERCIKRMEWAAIGRNIVNKIGATVAVYTALVFCSLIAYHVFDVRLALVKFGDESKSENKSTRQELKDLSTLSKSIAGK